MRTYSSHTQQRARLGARASTSTPAPRALSRARAIFSGEMSTAEARAMLGMKTLDIAGLRRAYSGT
jgi:hypothetical protein